MRWLIAVLTLGFGIIFLAPSTHAFTFATVSSALCAQGGSSSATCDTGSYNATAGDNIVLMYAYCGPGCNTGTTARINTSGGVVKSSGTAAIGTCVVAAQDSASHAAKTEIWQCPVTASGSVVMRATFSAAVYWSGVSIIDIGGMASSPIDAIGATNYAASGTSVSVALGGAGTSQANELVIGVAFPTNGTTAAAGTGYTLLNTGYEWNAEYRTDLGSGSTGPVTMTSSNNTGPFAIAAAAFKASAPSAVQVMLGTGTIPSGTLAAGSNGQVLTTVSGAPAYANVPAVQQLIPIGWHADDPNGQVIFTAPRTMTIDSIVARVTTAESATANVDFFKAPSGTACASGTQLNSTTSHFNAGGSVNSNQNLTLSNTALSNGDSVCISTSALGTAAGRATITVTVH